MCGIFLYLQNEAINSDKLNEIYNNFLKIKNRGPDYSEYLVKNNMFIGFHRLAINDLTSSGNQPMINDNIILICNGEIYNYKELIKKYNLNCTSHSDCESILKLYIHFKEKYQNINEIIYNLCNELDGEFAFIIFDKNINKIIVSRDRYGVRPLFFSINNDKFGFSSELKSLDNLFNSVIQFKPSCYMTIDLENNLKYDIHEYHKIKKNYINNKEPNINIIKTLLIDSVRKRLNSDRPLCALLSGGVDSSIVCGILSKYFMKNKKDLHTFSIGLKNSADLIYAKKVAEFIDSTHHEVVVTEEEMLKSITEVIKITETYDITTIRASTPNYLIAKYIKENSDFKVIFSGEMSDELFGSYLYFKNSPNKDEYHNEVNRLLENVYLFDNLRADRCISSQGLEARIPFSDHILAEYIQSIDPKYRTCNNRIEKELLRKSFEEDNIIPYEILYRQKDAFSDAVSNKDRRWFTIIKEYINQYITDDEFNEESIKYTINTPLTKEAYYYRKIYNNYYKSENIIPYFWMPKWSNETNDPSATTLKIYK